VRLSRSLTVQTLSFPAAVGPLLATTGSFTGEARQEATRNGATPVDLVDGEELCDLLKRFGLGVQTELREIEEVILEPSFFDDI
jgi:restriction system protein